MDEATAQSITEMVANDDLSTKVACKMLKVFQRKEECTTQVDAIKKLLKKKWVSRQCAIDDIKLHSTQQGRRVLLNHKESNGFRVVLMCASAISPGGKPKASECQCKYRVVIRKSKKKTASKPWGIKRGTKIENLLHCAMCTSQGKITFRELKHHLKTNNDRVLPTIKGTRVRIARDNKIPESYISDYVATRARLVEAKQCSVDYHANWSTLDQ